jgi:proline iminopeptidase
VAPLTKALALAGGLLLVVSCLALLFARWGTMSRLGRTLTIAGCEIAAIFCLLVLSAHVRAYEVAKTVEHDPSLPHFTVGAVVLHGETFGSPANPTVIAVHGGPGLDYRNLLPLKALSDEFFVVLYDQRGTGLSPRVDDDELTLDSYLADLDALVERYSAGRRVNLIGHSWGGMLVSSYLGLHPEKVGRVVLAAPGPLDEAMAAGFNSKRDIRVRFLLHVAGSWLLSPFASGPDPHASADWFQFQMLAAFEGDDGPFDGFFCDRESPLLGHWRLGRRASIAVGKSYSSGRKPRAGFVEDVEHFGEEVLIIAGACDVFLGPEFQREQMKLFPRASMMIIDGVGHEMFAENPGASIAPVREFLRSPLSAPRRP